jgi:purine-nucleoside phosphorylase
MTVVDALRSRIGERAPHVLLTLGSGLGHLAEEVDAPVAIPYAEVGLPTSTVPGHAGQLVAGDLGGVPVLVQQGRVHLYEGIDPADIVACVRAAAALGVQRFIVTNAAGGLAQDFTPGDLMLITDHLNLTGTTPLRGPEFIDMADAYDPGLRELAREAADEVGERFVEGVYAGLRGPAFETPAEVAMLRTLGADAVGMSTVLEVIAARAAGLSVLGCSVITNVHRPGVSTDHEEVLDVGRVAGPRLAAVVRALLPRL